jgi:Protein of unknown function (DUF2934)
MTAGTAGADVSEIRAIGITGTHFEGKSVDDYWTVMETLTAFVRERSKRNEAERTSQDTEQRIARRAYGLWQAAGRPDERAEEFWAKAVKQDEMGDPPADIAAVLTVINRRDKRSQEYERANYWRLNLSWTLAVSSYLRRHRT